MKYSLNFADRHVCFDQTTAYVGKNAMRQKFYKYAPNNVLSYNELYTS